MIYAGFWKRFAASLIDWIVLSVVNVLFIFMFGMGAMIFIFISGWLYSAVMESSINQGTLGKMALGIKVTDLNENRIDFGKATGRYFGKFISSMILCIGFIMVAGTQKKQGLHDIMAGCLVVNSNSNSPRDNYAAPEPIYKPLPAYNPPAPVEPGQSSVSIHCYVGELKGNTIPVPAQGIVFGRDPAKCQIVLSSNELSRTHVSIIPDRANPRSIVVRDMQSTNGVFQQVLDARQVSRWERINGSAVLGPGKRFRIGKGVAEFEVR